ncbi:MAG TPA: 50S ribosomal protein L9 [Verrucomicrobiae bacterium]|jgi:large subunit ribosomal protein L9
MAKTEVILIQNIVGLGGESDLVKVSAGYARNYLFPQGLAVPVTSTNKRRIEALKQRRAEREAHEFNAMSELSKSISKLIAVLQVKTGDDGKMFGAVTSGMIADQLKTQFDIVLDKRKIHLEHPIKTLGEHDIELRLHSEVASTLKLRVESTTPGAALPAKPAREGSPEGKEAEPAAKTESRGHKKAERTREEAAAPDAGDKGARSEKKPRAPRPEKGEKPAKAEKAAPQA